MTYPEKSASADLPVLCWREGGIAHIRFNRPEALNAIDLSLAQFKRLLRNADQRDLAAQLQAEASGFAACAATADFAEGVAAFLARRAPQFSGT